MHRILTGALTRSLTMAAPLVVAVVASAGGDPELPTRPDAPPARVGVAPPKRIPDVMPPVSIPKGEPVTVASLPRETRRAVVADAAKRFNVDPNAVVLARAERVAWPDSSLGCPEPGMMYAQRIVMGYRLVATTTQGELEYHADENGTVVSCGRRPPREDLKQRPPVDPVTDPAAPKDR